MPTTADSLSLVVNGESRTAPAGSSLGDLLRRLDLDPRLVVVERNREILRDRDTFDALLLADGDVLELVHFVGGG
jgi:thiamine biosynthesis protein ThiS